MARRKRRPHCLLDLSSTAPLPALFPLPLRLCFRAQRPTAAASASVGPGLGVRCRGGHCGSGRAGSASGGAARGD
jgi:hypothetical protein